jgi:hypothetical protein
MARVDRRQAVKVALEAGIAALLASRVQGAPTSARKTTAKKAAPFKVAVSTAEEYQVAAAAIANATCLQPNFAALLKADPVGTLQFVGLNGDALRELVHEDAWLRGIGGVNNDCSHTCVCASDGCCVTCWVASGSGSGLGHVDFGAEDPILKPNAMRAKLLANLIQKGHFTSPH